MPAWTEKNTNRETGKFESGPFMNTIVDRFVEAANNRQINLLVTGLDFMDLMKFKNQVEQRVRGVNKIENKGNEAGFSKLEVYFAGKTDDFAYELAQKSPNMGFNVVIKKTYPNKVDLEVRKK